MIIQWMCGYTRLDRIRNEVIRNKVKVVLVNDNVRENILRLFNQLKRSMDAAMKR